MNRKLSLSLLALCSAYLIAFYIIKFAFPEWLLLQVTHPAIVRVGQFFQSSIWLMKSFQIFTTFVTFYLFVCAARGKFSLTLYEALYILAASVINKVVTIYLVEYAVHTSTSLMFLLVVLCKGKIQYAVPSFVVYGYATQMMLKIRGFATILKTFSVATGTILGIEAWVWLFVFTLIFKMKEDKNNGLCTTIYRKDGGITTEGNSPFPKKSC